MTRRYVSVLLVAITLSGGACNTSATQTSASKETSTAKPGVSGPLVITSPAENDHVSGEQIVVKGTGADPKGQLEVSVLTNQWWIQDGQGTINPDGSWTYSPCNVSGKGQFNNHTIRVTVIQNGQRGASAAVAGIVRRD